MFVNIKTTLQGNCGLVFPLSDAKESLIALTSIVKAELRLRVPGTVSLSLFTFPPARVVEQREFPPPRFLTLSQAYRTSLSL